MSRPRSSARSSLRALARSPLHRRLSGQQQTPAAADGGTDERMTRRRHRRRAGVVNMGDGQEVGEHEAVDTAFGKGLPGILNYYFIPGENVAVQCPQAFIIPR